MRLGSYPCSRGISQTKQSVGPYLHIIGSRTVGQQGHHHEEGRKGMAVKGPHRLCSLGLLMQPNDGVSMISGYESIMVEIVIHDGVAK